MDDFARIEARAAERKGGPAALEALLPVCKSADELAAIPDDRYLSEMTKRIFQAGFVWRVVEQKWPAFEAAFDGFHPGPVAMLDDDALDAMMSNTGLIRNYKKLESARRNAAFVQEVARDHGSFGRFVADWPVDDIIGLWKVLKKRATRLGGSSGPYMLRFMGKDTFILSNDVVKALIGQGVVDKEPTSQKALQAVQMAFNSWQAQSSRPLCQLSRILACSVE